MEQLLWGQSERVASLSPGANDALKYALDDKSSAHRNSQVPVDADAEDKQLATLMAETLIRELCDKNVLAVTRTRTVLREDVYEAGWVESVVHIPCH